MTAQEYESSRAGHYWTHNQIHVGNFDASTRVSAESWLPVDPFVREIEVPAGSSVFEHLLRTAVSGGILYLTRRGRRVAAVVPADVAESFEDAEPEQDPLLGLAELVAEHEARCGPPPPGVVAAVDAQWAAAAAGR